MPLLRRRLAKLELYFNKKLSSEKSYIFFDKTISICQLALVDAIFKSSFLLQNFKLPFIQEQTEGCSRIGRPCVAEIRWYDGTDDGLVDVRPMVELWGNDSEIQRYHELRSLPSNARLTNTEIAEMVLAEDWPSKLKIKHDLKLDDVTS